MLPKGYHGRPNLTNSGQIWPKFVKFGWDLRPGSTPGAAGWIFMVARAIWSISCRDFGPGSLRGVKIEFDLFAQGLKRGLGHCLLGQVWRVSFSFTYFLSFCLSLFTFFLHFFFIFLRFFRFFSLCQKKKRKTPGRWSLFRFKKAEKVRQRLKRLHAHNFIIGRKSCPS